MGTVQIPDQKPKKLLLFGSEFVFQFVYRPDKLKLNQLHQLALQRPTIFFFKGKMANNMHSAHFKTSPLN